MKKIILFLSIFFISFIQAQKIGIKKSKLFKDDKKHTELLYSEDDGHGGIVTVRVYYAGIMKMPKGYYINHFDSNLKLIGEAEIDIDKSSLQGVLVKDDKVHLFERKKEKDEFLVNILTADLKTLKFNKRELFNLSKGELKTYFMVIVGVIPISNGLSQMDYDSFGELTFSKNKKFMVFNFDINDKENEIHKILVYNDNFEMVFKQEIKIEKKDRLFDYENVSVDDKDGSVYFLGKSFKNGTRKKKKGGKANYYYELYKIAKEGQKNISFNVEDHFVSSLINIKGGDHLSCVGMYSDRNDNRYKGVVRFNINPSDLSLEKSSFQPFTEQFVLDKYGKKKEKELKNITYKGVFMMVDSGDIILNAEEQYVTSSYNANTGNTYYYYHYDDIISTKIDASGKLLWARNINKAQISSSPVLNTESYTSSFVNDKAYLILNGAANVKKIKNDRIQFKDAKSKKKNLYAIEIDTDGDFEYKIIQTDKQLAVPIFVSDGVLVNNGEEMIFLGRRKKEKQLLKLSIN